MSSPSCHEFPIVACRDPLLEPWSCAEDCLLLNIRVKCSCLRAKIAHISGHLPTIFLLQYADKGRLPAVKQQIIDMTLNGSGVRDIVRVLRVSSATVINVLKKKAPAVKQVNERLLHTLDPPHVDVILRQVEKAEMDEMWSFVGSKSQQRWLWHAIDHHTGQILAYVFGTRADETFLQLKELLAPFGITHFYTDGWGAYRRHLDPRTHTVGKQHTQKIERKHITFRTRIKRYQLN